MTERIGDWAFIGGPGSGTRGGEVVIWCGAWSVQETVGVHRERQQRGGEAVIWPGRAACGRWWVYLGRDSITGNQACACTW